MSEIFAELQMAEFDRYQPETHEQEPSSEPVALTVSADDFSSLEERILRGVDMVKREGQAPALAEERAIHAETQLHEQAPRIEQLQKDVQALEAERDHVRQRVERLLTQLDTLEL